MLKHGYCLLLWCKNYMDFSLEIQYLKVILLKELLNDLNVKANVEVWGKSLLTINGNLDGNVTLDRDASVDSNILGDGKIKGKIITNPGKYRFMFRYNIGTSEQIMKYDQITVYLDENKTYTVKEILEALDFLGKEGYKFDGWSKVSENSPVDYTMETMLEAENGTTLYAVWSKQEEAND